MATFGAHLNSLRALIEGRSHEDADAALVESLKAFKETGSSDRLVPARSEGEAALPYTHGFQAYDASGLERYDDYIGKREEMSIRSVTPTTQAQLVCVYSGSISPARGRVDEEVRRLSGFSLSVSRQRERLASPSSANPPSSRLTRYCAPRPRFSSTSSDCDGTISHASNGRNILGQGICLRGFQQRLRLHAQGGLRRRLCRSDYLFLGEPPAHHSEGKLQGQG